MFIDFAAATTNAINFGDLGLSRVALQLGPLEIRWYSLAYISGILIGWWYIRRMLKQPGAPMAARHADDLVFYATLGVILGGRLGYVLFYNLTYYIANPLKIFALWDGGMSFHGGVIGVTVAIWWLTRKEKLNFLRVCDYVSCVVPIGMFFGRLANFVNGELWGRAVESAVPWAMIFPDAPDTLARHPSQLYQAGLEGLLMFALMSYLFWRTDARYYPGRLVGWFTAGMGLSRFIGEFFREPDQQLQWLAQSTGLSMGQWLCIPMILLGVWLIWTSKGRRQRVESFAGSTPVA